MLGLFAVYGIPSFFCGVGTTLLYMRWRDRFFAFPFKSNTQANRSERHGAIEPGDDGASLQVQVGSTV